MEKKDEQYASAPNSPPLCVYVQTHTDTYRLRNTHTNNTRLLLPCVCCCECECKCECKFECACDCILECVSVSVSVSVSESVYVGACMHCVCASVT
jgi:hypothetical protein